MRVLDSSILIFFSKKKVPLGEKSSLEVPIFVGTEKLFATVCNLSKRTASH